ncbi:cyanate permease [Sphingobium sp. JAI105]|nr:MFS transporter [Sphingobium sp. JAI105]MBG6118471.1 cyanate permease [Sphingobium sp. JAI105]
MAIASTKAIYIGTFIKDFGLSQSMAGYLLSVEMVAATVGTIVSTMLRQRPILIFALIAILIGNVGTALVDDNSLFFWQTVAGLGHGYAVGLMAAAIATVAHPQRLSGFYTTSYLILSSLCAMSLPAMKTIIGPHALFFILAVTGPLAMLAVRWFPDLRTAVKKKTADLPPIPRPLYLYVFLTLFIWYVSIGGFWPYMGQFGIEHGVSFDDRARILGSANLFGLAGAMLSIVVGDRFGSVKPLVFFIGLQTLAVIILLLAPAGRPCFMVATWLYVFAWLGGFPNLLGLLSKIDGTGRLNATLYVAGNTAYAVGPASAALLIKSGPTETIGLHYVQYAGFATLVLSGGMILILAFRNARAKAGLQPS